MENNNMKFIEEYESIPERIMQLQTELLQDILDDMLRRKYDEKWPQKIYWFGVNQIKQKTPSKTYYKNFVDITNEMGGAAAANVREIDTTLAMQIFQYNPETKTYFTFFDRAFYSHIDSLRAGRNSIKHRIDTISRRKEKDQINFYYSLCLLQITELYSFVEYLKNNTKYNPYKKDEFIENLNKKVSVLEEAVSLEFGESIISTKIKDRIFDKNYEKEISEEQKIWIRNETEKYYANVATGRKHLELFIKAIKLNIIDFNYIRIVEACKIDNRIDDYLLYFSDESIDYILKRFNSIEKVSGITNFRDIIHGDFQNVLAKRDSIPENSLEYMVFTLIIIFHICDEFRGLIEEQYSRIERQSAIDIYEYADRIVTKLSNTTSKYVNIPWAINGSNGREEIKIEDIYSLDDSIKIVGKAGSGKSTALDQLCYIQSQKVLSMESFCIPVIVELNKLTQTNDIFQEIVRQLHTEAHIAKNFLKSGEILLLLDGNDEIQDINIKKIASQNIEKMLDDYPKLRIFLTDRFEVSNPPVMSKNTLISFETLSLENKKKIIEKCCSDISVCELILNRMKENPAYFTWFDTPLKILNLVELASKEHVLPSDFIESYLEFLFTREKEEKKDVNVDYLKGSLEALSLEETPMRLLKAEMKVGKFIKNAGYSLADSKQLINIAIGLGILQNNMGVVGFIDPEYKDYFETNAILDGIDEIISE